MTFLTDLSSLSDAATQGEWKYIGKQYGDRGERFDAIEANGVEVCGEFGPPNADDAELICLLANRRREILALVEAVNAAMRWQDENCEDAELFKEWLVLTNSMKSALANLDQPQEK